MVFVEENWMVDHELEPTEKANAVPSGLPKGSGGVKGTKLARFDLVPPEAEVELAQVFGKGAEKYEDRNWEQGYAWSHSLAALERHVKKWKAGLDYDEESELHHLAHAAWHCFALITFHYRQLGVDDRNKVGLPNLVEAVTNPEIFSDLATPSREASPKSENGNEDAGPDTAPPPPGSGLLDRARQTVG